MTEEVVKTKTPKSKSQSSRQGVRVADTDVRLWGVDGANVVGMLVGRSYVAGGAQSTSPCSKA